MYRIEDSSNVDIKNRLGFFIPVIGDFSESGFNCDARRWRSPDRVDGSHEQRQSIAALLVDS